MRGIIAGGSLDEFLSAIGGASEPDDYAITTRDRGVQKIEIALLGDVYAEAKVGCRFRVSEWVTPRANVGMKGAGEPHLVVEVRKAEPAFNDGISNGSPRQGEVLDMRVLCYIGNDTILPFWTESWMFEPYKDEAADNSTTAEVPSINN